MSIKSLLATLVVSLSLAAPGWAQSLTDISKATGLHMIGRYAEALKLARPLAEKGDPVAQWILGYMYEFGQGDLLKNHRSAAEWYSKGAEQGYSESMAMLGNLYVVGRGVPQDYLLAHMWFNLAAARLVLNADKARDELARIMTPAQIAEAQRLAREWKPKK